MRFRARRRPDVSLLAGVPPFDRYPATALAPLAAHADRLQVPEGTVVAREGRRAREVLVVLAGALSATGGERTPRSYGPGTRIGAGEVLGDRPHGTTLVAGEGLEVLVLTAPAYRWAAQTLPGLVADPRVVDLRVRPAPPRGQPATFTA